MPTITKLHSVGSTIASGSKSRGQRTASRADRGTAARAPSYNKSSQKWPTHEELLMSHVYKQLMAAGLQQQNVRVELKKARKAPIRINESNVEGAGSESGDGSKVEVEVILADASGDVNFSEPVGQRPAGKPFRAPLRVTKTNIEFLPNTAETRKVPVCQTAEFERLTEQEEQALQDRWDKLSGGTPRTPTLKVGTTYTT